MFTVTKQRFHCILNILKTGVVKEFIFFIIGNGILKALTFLFLFL
jgi:hypothetical protein